MGQERKTLHGRCAFFLHCAMYLLSILFVLSHVDPRLKASSPSSAVPLISLDF